MYRARAAVRVHTDSRIPIGLGLVVGRPSRSVAARPPPTRPPLARALRALCYTTVPARRGTPGWSARYVR